jgi:pimeloyl-ACP methyl ester carboxylesterase
MRRRDIKAAILSLRWRSAVLAVLSIAALAGTGCDGADENASQNDEAVSELDSGLRLPVREISVPSESQVVIRARVVGGYPGGPTLLLINGGPGFSHDYMRSLEGLASRRLRVVDYDQRGVGDSTAPAGATFSLDDDVADLEALRRALGVHSFYILGHSFGGLIADAYVAARPERVAALMLVSPAAPFIQPNLDAQQAIGARIQQLTEQGLLPNPLPPVVNDECTARNVALWPAYAGDPTSPVPQPIRETQCKQSVVDQTFAALAAAPFDYRTSLAHFAAPTIVYVGEHDPFGAVLAQASVDSYPAAHPSLKILPGVGHYPWLEGMPLTEFRSFLGQLEPCW